MDHCKPGMRTALLLTGNEILAGDIIDTNSVFIARELLSVGIRIDQKLAVGDAMEDIIKAITLLSLSHDFVIANGGLGATVDDLTAEAVSALTGRPLVENPVAVENIKQRYGRAFPTENSDYFQHLKKQALLPEGVAILPNPVGLAVGFTVKINRAVFYFTPGVPQEMKAMVKESIIPDILANYTIAPTIITKKFKIVGTGESRIQQLINQQIPKETWEHIELGFRASMAIVEVKLTITDQASAGLLAETEDRIRYIFTHQIASQGDSLQEIVVQLLTSRTGRLAIIENCSAGQITAMINAVPAASAVFSAGMVYRQPEILKHLISINSKLISEGTSISLKAVEELAKQYRNKTGAEYVLVTSPSEIISSKEPNRPAKKMVICCGDKQSLISREFVIAREPSDFLTFVSILALDMLRRFLNKLPYDNPYYFDELTRSQLK